jgi:hypothetical protein
MILDRLLGRTKRDERREAELAAKVEAQAAENMRTAARLHALAADLREQLERDG